jgi:hypothetical protein
MAVMISVVMAVAPRSPGSAGVPGLLEAGKKRLAGVCDGALLGAKLRPLTVRHSSVPHDRRAGTPALDLSDIVRHRVR